MRNTGDDIEIDVVKEGAASIQDLMLVIKMAEKALPEAMALLEFAAANKLSLRTDRRRSSQIVADHRRSSQIIADHRRSSQIVADRLKIIWKHFNQEGAVDCRRSSAAVLRLYGNQA
eukprot:gene11009-19851_t